MFVCPRLPLSLVPRALIWPEGDGDDDDDDGSDARPATTITFVFVLSVVFLSIYFTDGRICF